MNIVALEAEKHHNLRYKADPLFSHVANEHLMTIVATEMPQASTNFPLVFVRMSDTGTFKLAAMLGLEKGENLVFNGKEINSHYVPVNIRRYPFFVGTNEGGDQQSGVLCFDGDTKLINTEEGEPLYTEDNKPSKVIEHVTSLLNDLIASEIETDHFTDFLNKHGLIHQVDLTLRLGEEGDTKLNGLYKIDEKKLYELDDEVVLEMHKRKYFPCIYAQLISMHQINRLLQLKAKAQSKKD